MPKKKHNLFFKILFVLFVVFIGLFIASESGYYEAKVSQKVLLTDKSIKKFEEDVLNGESVDINTYILKENKDYANNFTKLGDKFTESVEIFITDGFGGIIDVFKTLF
ncbi:MAG: hypothetical protein RSG95_03120, partial [Bacilli bacterium]